MVVTLLMFVILFACAAMLYNDGMWSNAIRLINVITAGLLAMNFFEPAADWLEQQAPAYSYFCDFVALWGLFIIFSLIFRLITDRLSQVKVKFLKMADQIGSGVLALWVGWVMVCFTMVSLHTAPLAKNCLFESFQPEAEDGFWALPRIGNGWDSRKRCRRRLTPARQATPNGTRKKRFSIRTANSCPNTPRAGQPWKATSKIKARLQSAPLECDCICRRTSASPE